MNTLAILAAVVAASSSTQAQPRRNDSRSPHQTALTDRGVVADLVQQLGSNDFALRDAADAKLRAIGMQAVTFLAHVYKETDDYEKRLRIQRIAEQIYYWSRIDGRTGFLGIQHAGRILQRRPGVPQYVGAVQLVRVVPGTAADRAGLREGDLIIAVDGVTLRPNISMNMFGGLIRAKRPGTIMTFKLYRGTELRTFRLPIGPSPVPPNGEFAFGGVTAKYTQAYNQAVDEFPSWWISQFRTPLPNDATSAVDQEQSANPKSE